MIDSARLQSGRGARVFLTAHLRRLRGSWAAGARVFLLLRPSRSGWRGGVHAAARGGPLSSASGAGRGGGGSGRSGLLGDVGRAGDVRRGCKGMDARRAGRGARAAGRDERPSRCGTLVRPTRRSGSRLDGRARACQLYSFVATCWSRKWVW